MQINVLIVDDQGSKIAKIVEALIAVGIPRDTIHVSQDGISARLQLISHKFDLLILDVALPMRPEDEPSRTGGIELLDEILARDEVYHVPLYIVGVTAYSDLVATVRESFERNLWFLLEASPTDNTWLKRIQTLVLNVVAQLADCRDRDYSTDVCVVTALRDPELNAIRELGWNYDVPKKIDNSTTVYPATFSAGNSSFSVIAAAAHRMGMVASAILATKLISTYRPRLLIMAGICAGIEGKVRIGDVVLANPVWDYQNGKYTDGTDGSRFLMEPDQLDTDQGVCSIFQEIIEDSTFWSDLRSSFRSARPDHDLTGHIGAVASGAGVISDSEMVTRIQEQHRKLLGIEMEAYGVYSAAKVAGPCAPVVFSIKATSDYATAGKDDRYRDYAAYTSARTVDKLLRDHMQSLLAICR